MKAKRFYSLRPNVVLGNFFPLGSSEGQGEGCEHYPSLHEGLPDYLMVCAGHLMSHSSALAAWRGKRSPSEKCICHEGMSGFDAYYHKEITLDVNTSIHMHSRMYFFPFTEHGINKTEHYIHVLNIFYDVCCLRSYTKVVCDIINELCHRCAKKCITCVKYYPFLHYGN